MKFLLIIAVLVAACAADIEKREADPGYAVAHHGHHGARTYGYRSGYAYGRAHGHGHFRGYGGYRYKREANPEPEPEPQPQPEANPEPEPGYGHHYTPYVYRSYAPVYRPSYYTHRSYGHGHGHRIYKREANPEPEPEPQPEADSEPGYGHRYVVPHYGHGYTRSYTHVSSPYVTYGHGLSGYHHLHKREASPEPEPEPEADPSYGHGYGYVHSRVYHPRSYSYVRPVSYGYRSYPATYW